MKNRDKEIRKVLHILATEPLFTTDDIYNAIEEAFKAINKIIDEDIMKDRDKKMMTKEVEKTKIKVLEVLVGSIHNQTLPGEQENILASQISKAIYDHRKDIGFYTKADIEREKWMKAKEVFFNDKG